MILHEMPTGPEGLTLDLLNAVIGAQLPGAALAAYDVADAHMWGSGEASSASRIDLGVTWADDAPAGLPRRVVAKIARIDPEDTPSRRAGRGGLYANEVNVYTRFRPHELVESPLTLGGAYDGQSHHFLLLMEDLRERGVTFANVTIPTSLGRMRSLLAQLATLHARYWNSPELGTSLGWMEHHTRGRLHDLFNHPMGAPAGIAHQIATEQFKREMVERMGTDADGLLRRFQRIQRHQSTLPQTVCHGDTHIGNTYALPDDSGGLIDWQLASQGYCLHDVSYLIVTGLSVAERRAHERDLLAFYREELLARGVADAPSFDDLWLEYRRAIVWGVYIGWLTTPVINYGWEITVMNHLRLTTAYEDHDTGRLIDALDQV